MPRQSEIILEAAIVENLRKAQNTTDRSLKVVEL
jgi:hypothetical protein